MSSARRCCTTSSAAEGLGRRDCAASHSELLRLCKGPRGLRTRLLRKQSRWDCLTLKTRLRTAGLGLHCLPVCLVGWLLVRRTM